MVVLQSVQIVLRFCLSLSQAKVVVVALINVLLDKKRVPPVLLKDVNVLPIIRLVQVASVQAARILLRLISSIMMKSILQMKVVLSL